MIRERCGFRLEGCRRGNDPEQRAPDILLKRELRTRDISRFAIEYIRNVHERDPLFSILSHTEGRAD
jgi:hypothetical protein